MVDYGIKCKNIDVICNVAIICDNEYVPKHAHVQ